MDKMVKTTDTRIVKRVQRADNGQHTYIVRETEGEDGNLGVTYIYQEDHLQEMLGERTYTVLDEILPDLDGDPDNLKAIKVTTIIEEVPVTELFTPIGKGLKN